MEREVTIFISVFLFFILSVNKTIGAGTIYVPDHYTTIQEAVNVANPYDVIIVKDGRYTENIDIKKDYLTIRSASGAEKTFIQGKDQNDHLFHIQGDYVVISGLTLEGVREKIGENFFAGIYLENAFYCTVSDNILSVNGYGVLLKNSSFNIIKGNTIIDSKKDGILSNSQDDFNINNIIKDNTIVNNNFTGIYLARSCKTVIQNNVIKDNGKGGIYITGESSKNIIKKNTVSSNRARGISIDPNSPGNTIYLNNFIDNEETSYGGYNSRFCSRSKITYLYNGRTHTNYVGNYWSDYVFIDVDNDGIGDTPHPIMGGEDQYPLMERIEKGSGLEF